LDTLTLSSSTLQSLDLLRVTTTPTVGTGSKILGNNQAPPVIDAAKIVLQESASGGTIVGSAGAIVDTDSPSTAIARNARTGATVQATVAGDGSFTLSVAGQPGDEVWLRARDGNFYPLESAELMIGTIVDTIAPAVTILAPVSAQVFAAGSTEPIAIRVTLSEPEVSIASVTAAFESSSPVALSFASGEWVGTIPVPTLASSESENRTLTITARDLANNEGVATVTVRIEASPVEAVRIDLSPWVTEAGFRARTLVRDGNRLAVATYPRDGVGSSQVVLLDVTDPAAPVHLRTISAPTAPSHQVHDLAFRGDFLFGIGSVSTGRSIWMLDLSTPASTPVVLENSTCTYTALAVIEPYLFTTCGTWDLRDPNAPLEFSSLSTPSTPTDLIPLGSHHLVSMSQSPDIAIIDVTNVNHPTLVASLDLPDFEALRGWVEGSVLWVVSANSQEIAAIDVGNTSSPVLLSRTPMGGAASGVTAGGGAAFVAAGAAGLRILDVENPSLPVVTETRMLDG
ncbi:MAG: hypothetical protein LC732_10645, partial [Acidobacteria bacterium]|nr:hypothetical protein [Acidobacteriota bacterium]